MPALKFRQDLIRTIAYKGDGRSQCVYWDVSLPGFGLRVYASNKRTFVCSYRVKRRKRLATLGRADVLTLDQARKKAKEYLGVVASDKDPLSERDSIRSSITVKEFVTRYVKSYARPKKKTWESDESTLLRNLVPKLGAMLARSITSGDIEPIHLRIGEKHPYAANTFLEVVRKMFNWGCVALVLPPNYPNPVRGIEFFTRRKRRRFITTAEMPRFLQAVEYEENEFARHAVWLLLLTGARLREILNAKWDHIDWDMRTLFVGHTKNGEPVLLPLSNAAIDRLRRIPRVQGNPYIICGSRQGAPIRCIRKSWLRIRTSARMPDLRIHDVRRTVGSWLAQDGRSLHLIGQVLNHLDTKTTAGYAYFQTGDRQQALTAHGERVLSFASHMVDAEKRPLPPEPTLVPAKAIEALPPKRISYYLTREELHRMVWQRPVMEVAQWLGVSDVGLSKICHRVCIPVPPRGYWAKLDGGQDVKPKPLPPAPAGSLPKVRVRGRHYANRAAA